MSYWAQHGYGKSDKLQAVAEKGLLTGVILSPADEDSGSLRATSEQVRSQEAQTLIDPQLYVHSIRGGTARCHESHGLDFGELSWFMTPSEIEAHVRAVRDANAAVGTSAVIAPSPYQASFGDVWTPLSLQYGSTMLQETDQPVYLSIIAEDVAFADWGQTQDYLDALTTLDVAGVYLVVGHSGRSYPFTWEAGRLANTLRAIHILAEYNRYDVIWGYADIAGLAGLAAGASGAATGWYHSLRMWSTSKWIPQSGGRQANPRFFVRNLLSPLEANGEAVSVARTGLATEVFSSDEERDRFRRELPWGIADSWKQHMTSVAEVFSDLDASADASDRVATVLDSISDALALLSQVEAAGAALSPSHRSRLQALREGLVLFADTESL